MSQNRKWLAVIYSLSTEAYVAVYSVDAYGDLSPVATSTSIGVAAFNGVAISEPCPRLCTSFCPASDEMLAGAQGLAGITQRVLRSEPASVLAWPPKVQRAFTVARRALKRAPRG
ncbi:MAG: hypothetical protein WBL50_23320 [Candidatus Acidiferrum sp.]